VGPLIEAGGTAGSVAGYQGGEPPGPRDAWSAAGTPLNSHAAVAPGRALRPNKQNRPHQTARILNSAAIYA